MARIRKIKRNPSGSQKNYYLIDASFLANKYIPITNISNPNEKSRVSVCLEWWKEIDKQIKNGNARVYIPDICIAETFKTLSKKYYREKYFSSPVEYNNARKKFKKDIVTPSSELKKFKRVIKYHDISTSRDIIIAVDRFYEAFSKNGCNVSLPDLIIVASAKYLIDFYDINKDFLHIVTLDTGLWKGSKKIQELPNAYDPTKPTDKASKVFS